MHGIVKEQVKLEKNEMEIKAPQSEIKYPAKVSSITKYSDNIMRRKRGLEFSPPSLDTAIGVGDNNCNDPELFPQKPVRARGRACQLRKTIQELFISEDVLRTNNDAENTKAFR